jgi:cobaltochelatase CobS
MWKTHMQAAIQAIEKKAVKDVFGLDDPAFAKTQVKVFGSTVDTPPVIDGFKFTIENLRRMMVWAAAASLPDGFFKAKMKRNLMIFGPTGCGKTELVKQFAARTGRPLFRTQCSEDTDQAQLFGSWKLCRPIVKDELVEDAGILEKGIQGIAKAIEKLAISIKRNTGVGPEMTFVDGPVLRWARTPNAILVLDESDQLLPTVAMSLICVLDGDDIVVPETGERVKIAPGALVAATANTNGRGSAGGNGGSASLYKGTKRQNIASTDRYFVINASYLSEEEEKELLMNQVGLPDVAATAMSRLAGKVRSLFLGINEDAGANGEPLEFTITTRNLLNWGMSYKLFNVTGMDSKTAFTESLNMTLLDFGSAAERKAVQDLWETIVTDA